MRPDLTRCRFWASQHSDLRGGRASTAPPLPSGDFMSLQRNSVRAIACALMVSTAALPSLAQAQVERGPIYAEAPAMNAIVQGRVAPQMDALLEQLMVDGRDLTMDGVRVFEAN